MVKKALLIGINYVGIAGATLQGCINDVQNMKAVLIANYGYTEGDIILLSDEQTNSLLKPTAQNIVGWLSALVRYSPYCEEIWIHYSGHGSRIRDTNGDEISGLDSVIVPLDFQRVGVIPDDYIYKVISASTCPTYCFFDSCNSGTVCDLQYSYEYISGNRFAVTKNNKNAAKNSRIYMISGSKDNQTSADIYDTDNNQYRGAFTDELLSAMEAAGYTGSLMNIYKDTCVRLAARGYSQKPILSCSAVNPVATLKKVAVSKVLRLIRGSTAAAAAAAPTRGALRSVTAPAPQKKKFGMLFV